MSFFLGFRGHIIPSLCGYPRFFFKAPIIALKLLALRLGFLATRRLMFTFVDSRGYSIKSHHELISYWDFFVELSFYDRAWTDGYIKSEHPVAIDVGANAGVFSYWLTTLNPKTEIFVFEPLPDMQKKLPASRRFPAAPSIFSMQLAVGKRAAQFSMLVSRVTLTHTWAMPAALPIRVKIIKLPSMF